MVWGGTCGPCTDQEGLAKLRRGSRRHHLKPRSPSPDSAVGRRTAKERGQTLSRESLLARWTDYPYACFLSPAQSPDGIVGFRFPIGSLALPTSGYIQASRSSRSAFLSSRYLSMQQKDLQPFRCQLTLVPTRCAPDCGHARHYSIMAVTFPLSITKILLHKSSSSDMSTILDKARNCLTFLSVHNDHVFYPTICADEASAYHSGHVEWDLARRMRFMDMYASLDTARHRRELPD